MIAAADRYKVIISHIKDKDNKVVYQITVKTDGNEKSVYKRYSQLKSLHDEILKCVNLYKLQVTIPEFPKRKLFGSTNKTEEGILNRQVELQVYLNDLLAIEKIQSLAQVQDLLPIAKNNSQIQTNITVTIERYSVYDDVVIYFMRFKDKLQNEEWVYKQRYSELRALHDALINQGYKQQLLPPFPQRKLFGMTNENPETIEKRREDLEVYLNELLSNKEIYSSEVIQFLISDSKRDFEKNRKVEQLKKNSIRKVKGDLNSNLQEKSPISAPTSKSASQQQQQQQIEEQSTP